MKEVAQAKEAQTEKEKNSYRQKLVCDKIFTSSDIIAWERYFMSFLICI